MMARAGEDAAQSTVKQHHGNTLPAASATPTPPASPGYDTQGESGFRLLLSTFPESQRDQVLSELGRAIAASA